MVKSYFLCYYLFDGIHSDSKFERNRLTRKKDSPLAKNRALTLKKAHLRREKIQSALLEKPDFLYIKDIADLCAMQTVDISNDLKEMTRLGLLSKKEDKTAHPKRLMYKLKPLAAARLVKESKAAGKKDAAKPAAAARQEAAPVPEKTVASAVPATKTVLSKSTQSKNGKAAPTKAAAPKPSSGTGVAKTSAKTSAKTAEKQPMKSEAPRQKTAATKPEVS
ncbi:MAG: hypothetical protein AB7I41_04855, partial [Candidatus Sericytochromatia bacterium]